MPPLPPDRKECPSGITATTRRMPGTNSIVRFVRARALPRLGQIRNAMRQIDPTFRHADDGARVVSRNGQWKRIVVRQSDIFARHYDQSPGHVKRIFPCCEHPMPLNVSMLFFLQRLVRESYRASQYMAALPSLPLTLL